MEFLVSYQTRGGIHLLALLSRSGADFRSYQLVGEPIQLAQFFFDAPLGKAAKVVSESNLLCFFQIDLFFFFKWFGKDQCIKLFSGVDLNCFMIFSYDSWRIVRIDLAGSASHHCTCQPCKLTVCTSRNQGHLQPELWQKTYHTCKLKLFK